jgi:phosphatidylserine decarboxylase
MRQILLAWVRERIGMVAIRREGFSYIVWLAIIATLLSIASSFFATTALQIVTIIIWVLVVLVINFFRDPERITPAEGDCLIAPADGKVIDVRTIREDNYLHAEVRRISIFMSVFDVHVNRAPLSGEVDHLEHHPGKFVAAFRDDASGENEHLDIGFLAARPGETGEGVRRVLIKLVAGYLARRIIFFRQLHDRVQQGERIGMIKFGSRVEVYLPAEWEVTVEKGQRVRAGETVVGRLKTDNISSAK